MVVEFKVRSRTLNWRATERKLHRQPSNFSCALHALQTTTAAMPGAYVEGGARGPEVCGAEHFTKASRSAPGWCGSGLSFEQGLEAISLQLGRILSALQHCVPDDALLTACLAAYKSYLPLLAIFPPLQVEDRPVVKERVQQVVEHRPVEKEFVVRGGHSGQWEPVAEQSAACCRPASDPGLRQSVARVQLVLEAAPLPQPSAPAPTSPAGGDAPDGRRARGGHRRGGAPGHPGEGARKGTVCSRVGRSVAAA